MEKIRIKNRKGQNIVVLVDKTENPKGLAFVMHGLSGNKDQKHIVTFAESFKKKGYTVIRFDTTNTFGESDGKYEDATLTNYYEDLEDVIHWSESQPWYQEPFVLAGHSFGGISILLYTEKYPEKVKGLAPISTVLSGELSIKTPKHSKIIDDWKKTGWREEVSPKRKIVKRLPWSHMIDRLQYDVLPEINKLTMPVLLIVGDQDDSTPYEHQKMLYDKLPEKKEIHVIKNAPHTFIEQKQLKEIEQIFSGWIDKNF